MNWNDYKGTNFGQVLRERGPLIAAAVVIVVMLVGFVLAVGGDSAEQERQSARDQILGTNNTLVPASPQGTTPRFGDDGRAVNTDGPGQGEHPEATPDDEKAALEAAVRFVNVWASPELSQEQWMAQITPLVAYPPNWTTVDPSNIPASAVIGEPQPETIEKLVSVVLVPTDAGIMRLEMDSDYRAVYIEPVATEPKRPVGRG